MLSFGVFILGVAARVAVVLVNMLELRNFSLSLGNVGLVNVENGIELFLELSYIESLI